MSSIKLRSQPMDGLTELKVLISHPMENGRNRHPLSGELIPAHFIEQLSIELNDKLAMTIEMAGSISANPYFAFHLKSARPGDRITASWRDNLGNQDSAVLILSE